MYDQKVLVHHGIFGMKWGIRRYQNKDGSLTTAGKKRIEQSDKDNTKKEIPNQNHSVSTLSKPIKDMSTDELIDTINRFTLEKRLKDISTENEKSFSKNSRSKKTVSEMSDEELAQAVNRASLEKRFAELNPEKVSKGKQILDSVINDSILPAGKQLLKDYIVKTATKKLGLNDPDELTVLRKEYDKLDLKKKIADLKNPNETDDQRLARKKREAAEIGYDKILAEYNAKLAEEEERKKKEAK